MVLYAECRLLRWVNELIDDEKTTNVGLAVDERAKQYVTMCD